MAAKNYVFVTGIFGPYLVKETKGNVMSRDRRHVTDNEILDLFEFYLRKWCDENNKDTVTICNYEGKKLFEAKLLDK